MQQGADTWAFGKIWAWAVTGAFRARRRGCCSRRCSWREIWAVNRRIPAIFLLAMLQQQGAAAQFLTRKNITEPEVRRQLAQQRSGPAQRLDRQSMAPDLRRTMDYALIGAQNAHVSRAEPEHLLCAMLEDDGCAAGLLLAEMGLSLTEAVRECRQLSGQFVLPAQPRVSASIPRGSRASDKYCRDLTRRAVDGELDPVFCREAELDRMVEILCRRPERTTPALWGEPGVGKTALAEGLAQRIANKNVPRMLQGEAAAGAGYGQPGGRHQVPGRFLRSALKTCWRNLSGMAARFCLWTSSTPSWCRCRRGRHRRRQHPETGACPGRIAAHRRHHRSGVPYPYPERCRAGAPLWPGADRGAYPGAGRGDPGGPCPPLRALSQRASAARDAAGGRGALCAVPAGALPAR